MIISIADEVDRSKIQSNIQECNFPTSHQKVVKNIDIKKNRTECTEAESYILNCIINVITYRNMCCSLYVRSKPHRDYTVNRRVSVNFIDIGK